MLREWFNIVNSSIDHDSQKHIFNHLIFKSLFIKKIAINDMIKNR